MIERRPTPETILQALAHPVRLDLVERIAAGDATVGQLAAAHPISLAAVSKHLQVLERAGLIERRRAGREFHFAARPEPLDEVQRLLDRLRAHWTRALDQLAALAEDPTVVARTKATRHRKTSQKTTKTPAKRTRRP